jgi:hypothetical protein
LSPIRCGDGRILSIFAGLFVFFVAGMMWAQRVAVTAAVRGSSTYLVAGILPASVNAVFFWRLHRQEVG